MSKSLDLLLISCFYVSGNLLHSESVGIIASILNVTQLLMESTGMFRDDDNQVGEVSLRLHAYVIYCNISRR